VFDRPDALPLRVVNLVEHELARDLRLRAVYLGGATLERRNHLLHHLVEEDVSQLRVDEGAELEGDLRRQNGRGEVKGSSGADPQRNNPADVSRLLLLTAKSTVQVRG